MTECRRAIVTLTPGFAVPCLLFYLGAIGGMQLFHGKVHTESGYPVRPRLRLTLLCLYLACKMSVAFNFVHLIVRVLPKSWSLLNIHLKIEIANLYASRRVNSIRSIISVQLYKL